MTTKVGEGKYFDNKQLLHIAAEAVIIIGVTFYFSSKNKKLVSHIEELSHRLEEQEDHINKLENALQQMNQKIESMTQQVNNSFMQLGQSIEKKFSDSKKSKYVRVPQKEYNEEPKPVMKQKAKSTPSVVKLSSVQKKVNPVQFTDPPRVYQPVEEEQIENENDESDLDEEIRAELSELSEDVSSLKKED